MLDWKLLRQVAVFGAIGLEVATAIVVTVGGGFWLDRKLNTSPWLTLLGMGLGVGVVGVRLWHLNRILRKEEDRED